MNIKQILNTAVGGYSLSKILSALVTLLVCLIAVRLIMKVVTRLLSRMQKVNERLQKVIRTSVKVLLYVLTVIITAEALGINTSSLTALLSVLTLGITLAAEDILGNVAGGLVILSSHPFALGDFIEAGGTSGTVREIGLNHTKLETANGQMILMPNKDLSSSKIINYTVLGRRRIVRTVTASYDSTHGNRHDRLYGGRGSHRQHSPTRPRRCILPTTAQAPSNTPFTAGAPWRTTGPPTTPSMRSCGTPSPSTMLK